AREALKGKDRAIAAFDTLGGYSRRMAHIARVKNRSLYTDAVLAADFEQAVMERAYMDGKFDVVELSERLTLAFQDQINGQLGFYGLTQDQLDQSTKSFEAMFRKKGAGASMVVFLRPLATAFRRLFLENEFLTHDASLSRLIPPRIS